MLFEVGLDLFEDIRYSTGHLHLSPTLKSPCNGVTEFSVTRSTVLGGKARVIGKEFINIYASRCTLANSRNLRTPLYRNPEFVGPGRASCTLRLLRVRVCLEFDMARCPSWLVAFLLHARYLRTRVRLFRRYRTDVAGSR